jgi:hypothetical protein
MCLLRVGMLYPLDATDEELLTLVTQFAVNVAVGTSSGRVLAGCIL